MLAFVSRSTLWVTRSFRLHLCLCLILAAGLSAALLTPDPFRVVRKTPLGLLERLDDAVLHCSAFAILAFAVASLVLRVARTVPLTLVVALGTYGAATEFLQSFVPGRTCDPSDALANMLGITAGMILTRLFARRILVARL